jgi:hypothetical protein
VRRVSRTVAISGVLAAVIALGSATTAVADPAGGIGDNLGWVRVSVNGKNGGGGGGSGGCDWSPYAGQWDGSYANIYDLPSYREYGHLPGDFWWIDCEGPRYVANSVPTIDPLILANYALSFIKGVAPSTNVNPARALVKLPTWFWADDEAGDITATAEVINQRAIVTATPKSVHWSVGEGASQVQLTCDWPGEAFDIAKHAPADESDCSERLTKAANDLPVTAWIEYDVSWRAEGAQNFGPIPLGRIDGPTSPPINLDVLQVETINR